MAEGPATGIALIRFLPRVDPLVLGEVCAMPEGLPAFTAFVRLLTRVCPLMVAE